MHVVAVIAARSRASLNGGMQRYVALLGVRGGLAAVSLLVAYAAVPRLGVTDGAALLAALAAVQVLSTVASSTSGVHAFRLGVAGEHIVGSRMRRLAIRSVITLAAVLGVLQFFRSAGHLSVDTSLVPAIVVGSTSMVIGRLLAEHQKGVGNGALTVLLETAPLLAAASVVLVVGAPGFVWIGATTSAAVAILWFVAVRCPVHRRATTDLPSRQSLLEGLLIGVVPIAVLLATFGPLFWLQYVVQDETASATYSILQRSFSPATIGLGLVSVATLADITAAHFSIGAPSMFRVAVARSQRLARLAVVPLVVLSVALAFVGALLADVVSAITLGAIVVFGASQLVNSVVGIPTEINLAVGRSTLEFAGAALSLGAMALVLNINPWSTLLVAASANLCAQVVRNSISTINLRITIVARQESYRS